MTDRPRIICLMTGSVDGGLHPSRYTISPDGTPQDWAAAYEQIHDRIGAQAWIVGRVTMAEMAKGEPHPPADAGAATRPALFQTRTAPAYAIAPDRSGKLHFAKPDIGGDHLVVLLGRGVDDAHLAELAGDGISYIVAGDDELDLPAALATLKRELGIDTLLLEGGGGLNGGFFAAGLVDELGVVVAPALDGAADAQRIVATADGLKGKVELSLLGCEPLAAGAVYLRYRVTAAG